MIKLSLRLVALTLVLGGCDGAFEGRAQQSPAKEAPVRAETVAPTRNDCLALDTRAKLACLRKVQTIEIATKTAQREENARDIAASEEILAKATDANVERKETLAALTEIQTDVIGARSSQDSADVSTQASPLTRADCLVLDTRAKLTCLREVQATERSLLEQRAADLGANLETLDERLEELDERLEEEEIRRDELISEIKGKEPPED